MVFIHCILSTPLAVSKLQMIELLLGKMKTYFSLYFPGDTNVSI